MSMTISKNESVKRSNKRKRRSRNSGVKTNLIDGIIERYGTLYPRPVTHNKALRHTDSIVWITLVDYAVETMRKYKRKYMMDGFYPGVLKSQKTIAEDCDTTSKNVRRAYKNLELAGFIKIEERSFKETNIIYLMGAPFGLFSPRHGESAKTAEEEKELYLERALREKGHVGDVKTFDPNFIDLFERWRDMGGYTQNEEEIVAIAKHYNSLARKRKGTTGYNSISFTRPTEHHNFKYFERLRDLCRKNGWSPLQYVEFIFRHSATYWGVDKSTGKRRFPYPKQMMGEKMTNGFARDLERMDKRYQLSEVGRTLNEPESRSYVEEMEMEIEGSVRQVSIYTDQHRHKLKAGYTQDSVEMAKALRIANYYASLAPAYLYTVPWFREYFLPEMLSNHDTGEELNNLRDINNEFNRIRKSPKYNQTAVVSAFRFENKYNVPKNIDPEELSKQQEPSV